MTEPPISHRRIDKLKAIAYDRGFTNEDAKQFGKLSKTATWEALLELYLVDGESLETVIVDSVDACQDSSVSSFDLDAVDTSGTIGQKNGDAFSACNLHQNSTFFDWVDFGQLIALALASVGVFVLTLSMWRQINPLNLFPPVRINIQIGAKYGTHEQNL